MVLALLIVPVHVVYEKYDTHTSYCRSPVHGQIEKSLLPHQWTGKGTYSPTEVVVLRIDGL